MKLKSRMETEALEITRLMYELAKKYPSVTALTVAVRVDVSDADERYGIRDRGIVDLEQIAVKDLGSIRRAGNYQSLLYGDYFWLPSKLQTSLDRILKSAPGKR